MAFSRDVERLARTFVAQRLERAYIKHYLMETYQLSDAEAEQVLEKVNAPPDTSGPRRGPAPKGQDQGGGGRVKKQSFF